MARSFVSLVIVKWLFFQVETRMGKDTAGSGWPVGTIPVLPVMKRPFACLSDTSSVQHDRLQPECPVATMDQEPPITGWNAGQTEGPVPDADLPGDRNGCRVPG